MTYLTSTHINSSEKTGKCNKKKSRLRMSWRGKWRRRRRRRRRRWWKRDVEGGKRR